MKVLFVAEAVTLAHVGRMLSLAESLDPARYERIVACDPRYRAAMGTVSVPLREIRTIPAQQFFRALSKGAPIYAWQDLVRYVEEDRELIRSSKPDVVVGDFRLSLSASARLERVPYVTVSSAYWSPYARIKYIVPDVPPARIFGVGVAQRLFDIVRPLAFAQHAAPMNRMLRHFKLPAGPRDLRYAYTDADCTLYSDVPELVPTAPLPANHQFIGPVQWAPNVALPAWWSAVPRTRPVIYVNLGSSGQGSLLPEILGALDNLPVTVIAATAGRTELGNLANRPFVADFLPGDQAVRLASIVVCNGGSPSCYQALAAGRPVIGVPLNLDQYLNMSLVERAGAGVLIRSGRHASREVANAVGRILNSPSFHDQATAIQSCIERQSPSESFKAALEKLVGPEWTQSN